MEPNSLEGPWKGARIQAMPSTHVSLYYHIIFSTKERRRMIADPWREELHAYLGGILREIDATPLSVGGPGDHVHVLLSLKATHPLRSDAADEARFIAVDSPARCGEVRLAGGIWCVYGEPIAVE
jgi:hypothetical protein